MSMKKSLLDNDESPSHDLNTICLDEISEDTRLSPNKHANQADRSAFHNMPSQMVRTSRGDINVVKQGDTSKKRTAIVTLHDIGQNHISGFQSFFSYHQFKPMLENFNVYHLNFPGQHPDTGELPQDYIYPSMEEMAGMVEEVFEQFSLTNAICFGIGAGANVFIRLGLMDPKHVECCILINPTCTVSSWSEWGHEKMSSHYLRSKGMTQFCEDFLLGYYFGRVDDSNSDLVSMVRDDLRSIRHPRNLGMLLESYSKRTNIKITRPVVGDKTINTLKCGTLILTGANSPSVDDTVDLNSKLDPANTTWIKISDATSLVLEEKPTNVTSAVMLFLQGYGHAMKSKPPTLSFTEINDIHAPPAIC